MIKLKNTIISAHLIYLYFDAYLLKSMFFRYGAVYLTEGQERQLQIIHEKVIVQKLILRANFLRAILCSRQNAVGIGLI